VLQAAVPPAPPATVYPVQADSIMLRCFPGQGADTLCRVMASYKTSAGKDTSMSRYFKNQTWIRNVSHIDTAVVRISNTDRIHLYVNGERFKYGDDNVLWVKDAKFAGGLYQSNPWHR
jgi:hypothetical protein